MAENSDQQRMPRQSFSDGIALIKQKVAHALSGDVLPCMMGQFGASVVFLIAVSVEGKSKFALATGSWGYALAVAIVAMVFSFFGALLIWRKPGTMPSMDKVLFTIPVLGDMTLPALNIYFLCAWWAVAVGIMTVDSESPFNQTKNGYFALWFGLASSIAGVGLTIAKMRQLTSSDMGVLMCLLVAAIVVLVDVLPHFEKNTGQRVYGLIVSIYTLIICGIVVVVERQKPIEAIFKQAIYFIGMALWFTMAAWLTFTEPFKNTGNGYFACWAGLICYGLLLNQVFEGAKMKIAADAVGGETVYTQPSETKVVETTLPPARDAPEDENI